MSRNRVPEFEHGLDTVLVTGALGEVGSRVVDRLADQDVEVVGVDLERPGGTRASATFRAVDLTEQAPTWETIHEVDPDAVVHLAAIADPRSNPDTRVFENNVTGTFNVLQAAGRTEADVVWTSSQAAYGALFADSEWVPDYLPIDEAHDRRIEDAYGLSKACGEEVAATVANRYGVAVTTVRPATILSPAGERARPHRDGSDLSVDETGGDFGAYVDVRDVVRLIEAALAADHEGHEAVLCAADENYLGRPTAEIVEAVCGRLPDDCRIDGRESALSNARAADLLGWRPEHAWPTDDATEPPTWR